MMLFSVKIIKGLFGLEQLQACQFLDLRVKKCEKFYDRYRQEKLSLSWCSN